MNKTAIQLTTAWLNVTATFTNGKSYSLQNKGPNDVLLYEGTTALLFKEMAVLEH